MTDAQERINRILIDEAAAIQGIILAAGAAIMEIYSRDFEVEAKANSSPLTEADMAAHHIIVDGLTSLPGVLGDIPVISEEGGMPELAVRSKWDAWWLVDPLDGTKEFVKRNGEFTVNIALVMRESQGGPGRPVAGWVFAPVPDLLYEGVAGHGARRITGAAAGNPSESPLDITESPGADIAPRIVASRSHRSPETDRIITAIAEEFGAGEIVSSGSSLKLCRVAEGNAELYPRAAPTMEWDTAAADGVCRAAGVRVVRAETGEDLVYGKENLLNPWFLVSPREDLLRAAVAALRD